MESGPIKEETIFSGPIKPDQPLIIKPDINQSFFSEDLYVLDVTYDITLVSSDMHIQREYISIPFVSETHSLLNKDIEILKDNQKVVVESNFNQNNKYDVTAAISNDSKVNAAATYIYCEGISFNSSRCISQQTNYTTPVKIGTVHAGNGEKINFSYSSGAQVTLSIGYKSNSSTSTPWTVSGTASKSIGGNSTVNYNFTGTVANAQYDLYANFGYTNEKYDLVYYPPGSGTPVVMATEYRLVPGNLIGPAATPIKQVNNFNNGKSTAQVLNHQWGYTFTIQSTTGLTMSYSVENTFSGGINIPTPVGAFSGSVTTSYKNSHSITYSTSNSGQVFHHYDLDNSRKQYYVTTPATT